MSQVHDTGCIHDCNYKKPVTIKHIDGAILHGSLQCPDCIAFYKSSSTFKIISESKEEKS